MFKSLWFMAKILLLVAIAVWVAEQPGQVEMVWGEYTLTVQMGAFIALFIAVIVAAILTYRLIHAILSIPRLWQRHRDKKAREKGLKALTIGLAAVAAGDTAKAHKQAKLVSQYWPDEKGLPDLLQAQVARLEGRDEAAQIHFKELMNYDDAAFLGVRGLLQAALEGRDDDGALALSRKALSLYPKQKWVLQLVYDLELRAQDWVAAEHTLEKAMKYGAIEKAKAESDKVAMLLLRAEQEIQKNNVSAALHRAKSALKIAPEFAPAVVMTAHLFTVKKQYAKAQKLIEKAWKAAPHPDMVAPYIAAIAPKKSGEPMAKIKQVEQLVKLNRLSIESHLAAAQICTDMALWGEARKYLDTALRQEKEVDSRVYALRSSLEEKAGSPFEEVQEWRARSIDAAPAPAWVCNVTGRVYNEWHAIVMPHGAFNSLYWGDPQAGAGNISFLSYRGAYSPLSGGVLDVPAKAG